jgi:starch synthase (maltosyl-transferring)
MSSSYVADHIVQHPEPGKELLQFRGDLITFRLVLSRPEKGIAALRTNLGQARIARREYLNGVDFQIPNLGRDWFDVPMAQSAEGEFKVTLPLVDIGHFEAKAFFLPHGKKKAVWMPGSNVVINVEPADTCCGNIIYNAFIRQFGPNKAGGFFTDSRKDCVRILDEAGYVVIPPSGTFRDFIKELDFIVGKLGCRLIQLLPIHTTPTTYGRMGRFGSPYASLSFTAVDPALAEFDSKATPLEQFIQLVDEVHARKAKILLDIAINHTGWAASLHETHPQWLVRNPEGKIEVPGAWGVRWEDLTKLDYRKKDLWHYMAEVFLIWCRRGVDGFRCDAGYMIPVKAWQYMIAEVREQFPDTIFFLEGLGGKISVMRELLNTANFNWAYSELFQNYDRERIESYLTESIGISEGEGITVHYAETHDNPRLASRSLAWAKMRTALCALCSHQGGFGFANGVEWFATEKINVHESPGLNWNAEPNQVDYIQRLATILKIHPVFHDQCRIRVVAHSPGNTLLLHRQHRPTSRQLLIAANLEDEKANDIKWQTADAALAGNVWLDLISGREIHPLRDGDACRLSLEAGEILCLTDNPDDLKEIQQKQFQHREIPDRVFRQRLRAKALDVFRHYHGYVDLGEWDVERASSLLQSDPIEFCSQENPDSGESRVIRWTWPRDKQRKVMLPPDHFLLVQAPGSFRVQFSHAKAILAVEDSLPGNDGNHWALITAICGVEDIQRLKVSMVVYLEKGAEHAEADLLLLHDQEPMVRSEYHRKDWEESGLRTLSTNGTGAMLFVPVEWGRALSRYDTLLGANFHPEVPVDKWIMLSRCRAWVVYQDYSQDINTHCLEKFVIDKNLQGTWHYRIPAGRGKHIILKIQAVLVWQTNTVQVIFEREKAGRKQGSLPDSEVIELIIRPDIENRSYHETTKAYLGPEHGWPAAIHQRKSGFEFQADAQHRLNAQMAGGEFVFEPEWHYMVHRPEDDSRGFDPSGDLFSPGYFKLNVKGGQRVTLYAAATELSEPADQEAVSISRSRPVMPGIDDPTSVFRFREVLTSALRQFIVRRGSLRTVMAGYPWFLDWGRDAIIVTRGLIAAGEIETAGKILKLFGQYEKNGTLPNMLQGENAANIDTSDASLWFMVACRDIVEKEKKETWLDEPCGDRTIRDILYSIVHSYMNGTPNGIRMDAETGLIFSPSHFTWMDTNHPAGTPREGYPVEIQALWYAALDFLGRIDAAEGRWSDLAKKVQRSIHTYFRQEPGNYLADCLVAKPNTPVQRAEPDDALRPNQLFAITMGAVGDQRLCRGILDACQELLVPGGIRSLADRPVHRPLEILHGGRLLSDPHRPYRGRYEGDEDTSRKPAYHNGTAWTWPFPSFCEAWAMVYGKASRRTALAWLGSIKDLLENGCIGQVPEILDGDFPHRQRGCPAQAWGVSETLRVWLQLTDS